ncbi:MAG: FtsX-like permease family protein, partial [Oscillospiraceae bacterium]
MKSLFKDMWRELLKSKSRFISIFLIIALGTGFFAGVKVSSGDMINTVRKYYNSTNLADVKLISTLGFTDNDIDEIKNTGANVNAGYFLDVILNNLDNKLVVRTMSFDIENYADENYINKPVLVEGSFPQNKNEILIDSYACPSDIKIGSKIKFEEQVGENSVLDTLDSLEYTVVGKVNSSSYISKQRGTTTVGSGQIDLFAYIPKEKYITDVFTEVYVTYDDLRDTKAYTKKYDNGIKEKVDKLKQIGDIQSKKRYDEIYSDANYEIIKAKGNILAEETSAKQKLDKAKAELDAAKLEVEENQQKIDYAAAMGMDVSQMQAQLEEAKQQIKKGEKEYNDGLSELNSKINEAKLEIDKAEIKLNDLQKGEWFVLDRTYNTAYDSFKTDADRVDAIAKVFPVFFIVVAILVCLTTMTRMVEDNRTQVGVLKALGVSNGLISFKYISYALVSSLLGSVVGLAFGFKVLPILIYNAYKSMYQLPKLIAPFKWDYFIIITISAILCTVLTAKFIISSELKEQPSQLMRPKAPKAGKRIFLEKMNFVWKRFSFLQKITARNIFRNKQRMLMTIIGIAGCTALMLAGFGLYDAISVIGDRQYKDIFKYDTLVAFKDDFSAENSDDFISFTQGEKSVEKAVMV